MKTENAKIYGEYVEIASPIQETVLMTQNVWAEKFGITNL